MKLVTFAYKNNPEASFTGILEGDQVFQVSPPSPDMRSLVQQGIRPTTAGNPTNVDEVVFRAPLMPRKIIGIGRNYAAHADELGNKRPEKPLLFAKFVSSVIGDGDAITWRESLSTQVDWEGELAVIIGQKAYEVSEEDAMKHVYGYTLANDVSARDLQDAEPQWIRGKSLDTFCPLGPCIVTADEIIDPHDLTLKTTVSGEEMQNANTGLMMFRIPTLVSFCSHAFTLESGDVILTGTPAGVGKKRGRFLGEGDVVEVEIEAIGNLTNPCKVVK